LREIAAELATRGFKNGNGKPFSASCGQVDGRGADTRSQLTLSSGVKANADRHSANVLPIIHEIQRAGARSLRAIAEALTARGVLTARGGRWQAMTVSNVIARA
jgi:hypothetical protein